MTEIRSKGLRWNANRLGETPPEPGMYIVFFDAEKRFVVGTTQDLLSSLRGEWWKKNFWYFSWFKTSSKKSADNLLKSISFADYDAAWKFNGESPESGEV